MSKSWKNILLIMVLLLLTSCSSAEYRAALSAYQSAKSTQNLEDLICALNTLAKLAPETYQAEYVKAEQANTLLEQAFSHQAAKNDYDAYLSSHASYRSVPNASAKKILIRSGENLLPLLKAKMSIDSSFQYRPAQLTDLFQKYSVLPVSNWDLIEVNTTVEHLSRAIKALQTAFDLAAQNTSIAEVTLWQAAIAEQVNMATKARDYLTHLALYHSANILKKMNNDLSAESTKLLALVRQKLAKASMQPAFLSARNQYAPFQSLVVNLSLAANLSVKDKHVGWYQHWHNLELATLEPSGEFKDYPLGKGVRETQFDAFLDRKKIKLPILTDAFNNKSAFQQRFPKIIALTEKLQTDKALLI
tara:strand:+ start:3935 stop:5017 length:1083 start_codon:yes stop_codon:yes gene_type:complete